MISNSALPKKNLALEGALIAELNKFFAQELAEDGYEGIHVRNSPERTEIIISVLRTGDVIGPRGRRIRNLKNIIQERFNFAPESFELFVEKTPVPGLSAIAQAEYLRAKLIKGLGVRSAGHCVLRNIMDIGALGCEIIVAGKLFGQRAKSRKFVDGLMISSGDPYNEQVDTARCFAPLKLGVLGIKVSIRLPFKARGRSDAKKLSPDKDSFKDNVSPVTH